MLKNFFTLFFLCIHISTRTSDKEEHAAQEKKDWINVALWNTNEWPPSSWSPALICSVPVKKELSTFTDVRNELIKIMHRDVKVIFVGVDPYWGQLFDGSLNKQLGDHDYITFNQSSKYASIHVFFPSIPGIHKKLRDREITGAKIYDKRTLYHNNKNQ